jgi:hypothetical protein
MKLSEKKQSTFTPHPDSNGEYVKAVLVDITDLKKRTTQYGEKDEFRLVFETEVMDTENDRRFCIWSRGYTPSLNEKAALRKDLKRLMGRELTTAELSEFDVESLIGFGVKLIIQHETKDDRTYANISFMVPDKEKSLKPSGKYKRMKDREDKVDSADSADSDEADEPAASGWAAVVIHVGKHKGKTLGALVESDDAAVKLLMSKWLPQAKAAKNLEDAGLVAALDELAAFVTDDIPY